MAFSSLLSKPIFLSTPSSSGSVCTDWSSKASDFMEQMVSKKQITMHSSSAGPGGPGFDDMVLIVGHFHDSSEQRIRFPSSDDFLWQREFKKSGRSKKDLVVEESDWWEAIQRHVVFLLGRLLLSSLMSFSSRRSHLLLLGFLGPYLRLLPASLIDFRNLDRWRKKLVPCLFEGSVQPRAEGILAE